MKTRSACITASSSRVQNVRWVVPLSRCQLATFVCHRLLLPIIVLLRQSESLRQRPRSRPSSAPPGDASRTCRAPATWSGLTSVCRSSPAPLASTQTAPSGCPEPSAEQQARCSPTRTSGSRWPGPWSAAQWCTTLASPTRRWNAPCGACSGRPTRLPARGDGPVSPAPAARARCSAARRMAATAQTRRLLRAIACMPWRLQAAGVGLQSLLREPLCHVDEMGHLCLAVGIKYLRDTMLCLPNTLWMN